MPSPTCWSASTSSSSSSSSSPSASNEIEMPPPIVSRSTIIKINDLRLRLSYPGWERDFMDAERALLTHTEGDVADMFFFKMEEKERMVMHGDRSHPRLVQLDSYCPFSYPGWHLDMQKTQDAHVGHRCGYGFDTCLRIMIRKQNVHVGNRSHPDLVELDRLRKALSYAGWEHDVASAEKYHLAHPHDDFEDVWVFRLVEKQRMHYGDRSHVRLQELDFVHWTYPGWEHDKRVAEEEHVMHTKSPWFGRILHAMKNRQRVFDDMERRSLEAVVIAATNHSQDHTGAGTDSNSGVDVATSTTTIPKPELLTNCVICLTEPRTHAFIPCGHLCACTKCAMETFGRYGACPICRQESDMTTHIFFS